MPVFKTNIRIVKQNYIAVLLYVVIFIGLAIIMASDAKATDEKAFKPTSISLGIVDRDLSSTSKAIINYLSEYHKVIPLADDKELMQDELYYRNVEYILIIPTQFETSLFDGADVSLDCIKIPNSNSGLYVDLQIEQLLRTLRSFLSAGYDLPSAMLKSKEVLASETNVSLSLDKETSLSTPKYYYYYKFLPYILIALMIQTISTTLYVFNKQDIRKRNICSSESLKSRNFQLVLGSFVVSICIYLLVTVVGFILYRNEISNSATIPYCLLNSFIFLIVSISLGYFIGIIGHNLEAISAYGTILSLAFSFLGGVFVPLSVMSENVKSFSRFVPTYWYTKTNDLLMNLSEVSAKLREEIFIGYFVQLCFALAIFCIALVFSKKKLQES